jgi:hypothetical protein
MHEALPLKAAHKEYLNVILARFNSIAIKAILFLA